MNPILCPGETPTFLKIFGLTTAPQLLFYTYIPAIIISLFLGFYVYKKTKGVLESKIFFLITLFFALWVFDILALWLASYNSILVFGWQITPIFEVPIFIFSIYFTLAMTSKNRSDISQKLKLLFIGIMYIVFLILPTHLNIVNYNIATCEGVPGMFWDFMYIAEMITIASVLGICIERYRSLEINDIFKKQIIYFGFGIVSFLFLFVGSNIIGQITGIQEISFFGSLGMVLFLSFLVYLIIRFKTFNIKLLGAQVLVWTLVILVGSEFLFVTDLTSQIMVALTLIISSILGLILVRSVKKEDALNEELGIANAGQKNLIHIMNHQIKGYLGVHKNIFAELLTDDYGKVPDEARDLIEKGLESADKGQKYVSAILKGASAESGTLTYDMQPMDFKNLLSEVMLKEKEIAEKKGLKLEADVSGGDYNMMGDSTQLSEAVRNLIENSINYTPSGSIKVYLSVKGNTVSFKVKDTGVGIKEEDRDKIFKAGGVSKDSIKLNTNSSGYGLAYVKNVIENHKGKVWFESAGADMGTTFFVELPVK